MPTYDVYLIHVRGGGRQIPGTTRRADSSRWVAVEVGPLDARTAPEHATQRVGPVLADSKEDAIRQARTDKKGHLPRRHL